jgi:CHAT domain-containing protein
VSAELGAAYLQAGRLDEAQPLLEEAVTASTGAERARYAIDLANLSTQRGDDARAAALLREAAAEAGSARAAIVAELNLARLAAGGERLERLRSIAPRIAQVPEERARAVLHLNLGHQAAQLGDEAVQLAYGELEAARATASSAKDARLLAESLDALSDLYESRGRTRDALLLAREGIAVANGLEPARAADLAIALEWRIGRLAQALGDDDLALASYQRTVAHVEAVRNDIPIEYEDRRSSYRVTLEPIYQGYVNLLFKSLRALPESGRAATLARVRDVVELTRQAELQDYLGDRCDVEAIQRAQTSGVGPRVAVLYPIVFADRTELLLETERGISWRTVPVQGRVLRTTAALLANNMRGAQDGFLPAAQALHRWLLAPYQSQLDEMRIDTLIVVPEGALRLVPMSALHDGRQFLIERMAVGTVTGLTMTNLSAISASGGEALVAGMSVPGPVVEKLPASTVRAVLGSNAPDSTRSTAQLREALSLPGVKDEVRAIAGIVEGRSLLDESFTASAFEKAARSGDYRIVHIASHGVFGGSADTSYIMAFDDVIRMRDLQSLLRSETFRRRPIELLSLSACQSAEGDDRSPLGISGAAVKARARSVLGTLWPVEDEAARAVMERFYAHLAHDAGGKAKALQSAQLETMRESRFAHPFFWAPFVLIGNWH